MNPLVQALSKGKSGGEDYGGDLHTRKSTHISVPTESAEFHFASGEMNVDAKVDQTYVVCFPVVCSSADGHDVRFKQVGRPYLEDERVFNSGENDSNDEPAPKQKIPLVRTVTEQVP